MRWVWLGAVFLAACDGTPPSLGPPETSLRVEPDAVELGELLVARPRTVSLQVRNVGAQVGRFEGPQLLAASGVELGFESADRSLGPGTSQEIAIEVNPIAVGELRATLRFRVQQGAEMVVQDVPISAEVLPRQLAFSSERLEFGPMLVGTELVEVLDLSNGTEAEEQLELFELVGAEPCSDEVRQPFCMEAVDADALSEDGILRVPPLASAALRVRYRPQMPGPSMGRLSLRACQGDPSCLLALDLRGEGVGRALRCEPDSVDFGSVNPGACVDRSVDCRASAQLPVDLLQLRFAAETDVFRSTVALPAALEPGGDALAIPISFCPDGGGAFSGALSLDFAFGDGGNESLSITLVGQGGGPDIEVLPSELDFGRVAVGVPSRRFLTVSNGGTEDLAVLAASSDSEDLSFVNGEAEVLSPGSSRQLEVVVTAQSVGAGLATVGLSSNDRDEPTVEVPVRFDALALEPCQLASPGPTIDFGDLQTGRTTRLPALYTNEGDGPCLLTLFDLGSDVMGAGQRVDQRLVPPGASALFELSFTSARLGLSTEQLLLEVSDRAEPVQFLQLEGRGVNETPRTFPAAFDFGTSNQACGRRESTLRLWPVPTQTQSLVGGRVIGKGFALTLPALPVELAGDAPLALTVAFDPQRTGLHGGRLELDVEGVASGQLTRIVLPIRAERAEASPTIQRFELPRKQDLLFVIDDSASSYSNAILPEEADIIFGFLEGTQVDYRIAITGSTLGTSDGPFQAFDQAPTPTLILTPGYAGDPAQAFADTVRFGGNGAIERIFGAAFHALSLPLRSGRNAGFRRPDAALLVILMTEESEQSPQSVEFYADFLRWEAGLDPDWVRVAAFSGGRDGLPGVAPAPRMVELATEVDGLSVVARPFVDPFHLDFEQVADELIASRSSLRLRQLPAPDSIQVAVGGQILDGPNAPSPQWSWDPLRNRVLFEADAAPRIQEQVELRYTQRCD
ncbi:MAG: choice-of-anchor D domain-containing protein [Myxococcota bacterium]